MSSNNMFEVVYKTVDDCQITTDVYVPGDGKVAQKLPTLIMIHGGAFMLGHSRMNSKLQIEDCLERGWIVVAPDHRLCPQVDLLEGPISDCRDLFQWIQSGHLDLALSSQGYAVQVDTTKIVAMGTSSGGLLVHCLAFDTPTAPLAILDFYGAKNFTAPFWSQPLTFMKPPPCTPEMEASVYNTKPVATRGGISLEGQRRDPNAAPVPDPRHAFAMNVIASGRVVEVIYPPSKADPSTLSKVDPVLSVHNKYPPTCIVHGLEDVLVPIENSKAMFKRLQEEGIECKFIEVEGEGHTFAGGMQKGTKTWDTQRQGFDWLEEIVKRT